MPINFGLMKFTPYEKQVIDDWWANQLAKGKIAGRYPEWKPTRPKKRWKRK